MDSLAERIAKLSPQQRALLELRLQKKNIQLPEQIVPAPLPREQGDSALPLSVAQERLWFLHHLDPDAPVYNIPSVVRLQGTLDVMALRSSFNQIVQRHENLRTTYTSRAGQPVQVIAPRLHLEVPLIDLASLATEQREAEWRTLATCQVRRPFQLADGPLLRAVLLRLGRDEHVLVLVMHHITSDGWSIRVFIREFVALYEANLAQQLAPLRPLPIQYADFAHWQRQWLQDRSLAAQLTYWKEQLAGAPPMLHLPTDRPRPLLQTFRGAQYHFALPGSLSAALAALSKRLGVTRFMILLATLKLLLYHYTGQKDIVVGSGIANRNRVEIEGLIGFLVNTLVLRTVLAPELSFRELLACVRTTTLGAYANSDVPFEKLLEALQIQRNPSYPPLLQVTFTFQNIPVPTLALPDLTLQQIDINTATSKFDLELYLEDKVEELAGFLEYNTDLFDEATIARMIEHYQLLLANVIEQPDARLDALLSSIERLERGQRMDKQNDLKQTNAAMLKGVRRKAVSLAQEQVVRKGELLAGVPLPVLIQPEANHVQLLEWVTHHRDEIDALLHTTGGVLFRHFAIDSIELFERLTQAIHPSLLNYTERSTQRTEVSGKVYTSTEYPADQHIPLHNELSYSHQWPMRIFFYSVEVAQQGGETPIADSRKVFQLIPPDIRQRFIEKQVMYVRNYGEGVDLPWQTVFQTTSKAEVEAYCRASGIRFEWKPADQLRTWQVRQSVAVHPLTRETVWFNQAHLFHISGLRSDVRAALLASFAEEDLQRHACYGDGSPIEPEALEAIRAAYAQATISFPWQMGDLLVLDNMLVAHGRAPFVGRRRVVVTMADPFNSQSPDSTTR